MFLVNALWAIVAMALTLGMFVLIARAKIIVQWGDLNSGLAFQRARNALLRLEQERYHPKNWRPSILALSGGAWNRLHLVRYACLLSSNCGIVSLAQIISGELENRFARRLDAEKSMRKFILEEEFPAFPVVVVDENFKEGLKALLQCHGIGGLRPNTVLLGWSGEPAGSEVFSAILDLAKNMDRSLLVVHSRQEQEKWDVPTGAINIWWNDSNNASMMLLMGFLLRENREWHHCPLRILRPVSLETDVEKIKTEMVEVLSRARIDAEIVVMPTDDPLSALEKNMMPSAVLFVGFEPSEVLTSGLQKVIDLPGDVILTYNAGDVSLFA
jgi:hypothetical protein